MRTLRAILKTVWLYSLALWVYAAAVALADPDRVSERFLLIENLPRTDTSGTIAFGVSAISFLVLRSFRRVNGPDRQLVARVTDSTLRTIAFYAFLGWIYIAGNVILNPNTLPLRLTHLATRTDRSSVWSDLLRDIRTCGVCLVGTTTAHQKQTFSQSSRSEQDSAFGVDHCRGRPRHLPSGRPAIS